MNTYENSCQNTKLARMCFYFKYDFIFSKVNYNAVTSTQRREINKQKIVNFSGSLVLILQNGNNIFTICSFHKTTSSRKRDDFLRNNLAYILYYSTNNGWKKLANLRLDASFKVQCLWMFFYCTHIILLDTCVDVNLAKLQY